MNAMKNYEHELDRHSRENRHRAEDSGHKSGYGHNFGQGSSPYGESYGEDNADGIFDDERDRIRQSDLAPTNFRRGHRGETFPESFLMREMDRRKYEDRHLAQLMPGRYHYSDPWYDAGAENRGRHEPGNLGKGPKNY